MKLQDNSRTKIVVMLYHCIYFKLIQKYQPMIFGLNSMSK